MQFNKQSSYMKSSLKFCFSWTDVYNQIGLEGGMFLYMPQTLLVPDNLKCKSESHYLNHNVLISSENDTKIEWVIIFLTQSVPTSSSSSTSELFQEYCILSGGFKSHYDQQPAICR